MKKLSAAAKILLVLLYSANSFGQDDGKHMHALCAAANAVIYTRMGNGVPAGALTNELQRHRETALRLGATQSDLKELVAAIATAYISEELTWDEIVEVGIGCSTL